MHLLLRSFIIALVFLYTGASAQLNVAFRSNLPISGTLANIGGYVDSSGNEYALVGYSGGLQIIDVTDPVTPVVIFNVPGTTSNWREVKTWQNYAYVTTEGCCNGLQIINLGYLPDSFQVKTWKGTGAIANQLETIHALHIDAGYAYLFGSNLFNGAAVIADLADPWNPVFAGSTPGTYIHDGYVRNDTLWAGHIYDGYFSVMDVSNKANPVMITTQTTPGQFTHNTWLNDQGNVLFTTDEVNSSYLTSYDISDLGNIQELNRIQLTPGSGSIVHNTHTINDFEVVSWYKDGIAIVDVSRPDNMIITGHYDTYTQGSGSGFDGCWGVYPYLPSGTIVASDMSNGLYVLTPDYVRGCYLEGVVTDSITGTPLNAVTVNILNQNTTRQTQITGEYKTGLAAAGTYDVEFSKAGYITKTITGVNLLNGILTTLDVELASLPTVTVTGQVTVISNGNPVPNAMVVVSNSQFSNQAQTDVNGNFTIPGFYAGTYDISVGKWGYVTECLTNQNVDGSTPVNVTLAEGYYDDFSLDFGWQISGTSPNAWERGDPVGTSNQGTPANPGSDVSGDCGGIAFVTDNGGGSASAHDIDNGDCILTSPIFDLSALQNPHISYFRWFFNASTFSGPPDDTLKVILSNGLTSVVVESVNPSSQNNSTWVQNTFRVADFLPPTSTMQLTVEIGDPGPVVNLLEGGFDKFLVSDFTGLYETVRGTASLNAVPNPFSHSVELTWKASGNNVRIEITDVAGRLLQTFEPGLATGTIITGDSWPSGCYFARIINDNNLNYLKFIKQ